MNEELIALIQAHPQARIVTDVGASLFSGWGDLCEVIFRPEDNAIELVFS